MNFTRKIGLLAVMLGAILLVSCDNNKPFKDIEEKIAKMKQEGVKPDAGSKDSTKKEVPPETAKYESEKRRSPFEIMDAAPSKGKVSSNPLQAYPLDMLRFVGTVTQNGHTVAFISAPDNKIYQIKAGDIIGDHDSEVINIDADRISLVEHYSEDGSEAMKRVVTLQLKEISQ